uniref:CCT domain-containing protein n=1 Tax=Oryza brachyantha TaxID=4533 RepID=J3MGF5_ORYBR
MPIGPDAPDPDQTRARAPPHSHAQNRPAKDVKLDYLFSDLDPYLNVEFARFPHADSVVPNGGGGAAIELDFTCGLGGAKQSYSSYTATDLAHSGSSSEVGVVPEAICCGGGGAIDLDFTRPKPQPYLPYTATPPSHSVSSVDVGVVPEPGETRTAALAPAAMGEGREARLMRYREKRKNRRFEKTIRYASRKAYAETRPRIKGRFAKRTDHDADADADDADADVPSSYMLDFGYGVVPSF